VLESLFVVLWDHVVVLTTFKGDMAAYLAFFKLLFSNLCEFSFFMVDIGSHPLFVELICRLAVLPEIDCPGDIVLCGMWVFDEMTELSNVFGHNGMTLLALGLLSVGFFHYLILCSFYNTAYPAKPNEVDSQINNRLGELNEGKPII